MKRRIRTLVILASAFVIALATSLGAVNAAEPDVPATGSFITEDPDSTPTLPSFPRITISEAAPGTDLVRFWLRDNRATGSCTSTQGPAIAASVLSYDAPTGDLTGTIRVWCPAESTDASAPVIWNYNSVDDQLDIDGQHYRRLDKPVNVGLVDVTQGSWMLQDGMGSYAQFFYGNPGDFPILGDWDCDGIDTPGMYRQSDGFVYLRNSNTQGIADIRFFFGNPGDVPIVGDFNNDGCDTVSIYRPSDARFFIINALGENDGGLGAAETDYLFGNPGDKPFVGDFDGDGIATVGLHRETTGLVYFRNSHTQGSADNQFIYGDPNDRLITGDWIDDGTDTPAIFRPSNTTFYLRYANTQGNANDVFTFGNATSVPVAGHFGTLKGNLCDQSYPGQCVPPAPPGLNCSDVATSKFAVILPDLHGFDGNNDGIGCE